MKKCILSYLLILLSLSANSQQNYTITEGLSANGINSIFQDSFGFIWIGTANGINRFDGYDFVTYDFYAENTPGFNKVISDIEEDSEHNLWISTKKGLYEYIRSENKIRSYYYNKDEKNGILNNMILSLKSNGDSLYISCYSGISILNLKDRKFSYHISNPNNNGNKAVLGILLKNGEIWAHNYFEIFQLNPKLELLKTYKTPLTDTTGRISKIVTIDNNTLLVSTWRNGCFSFNTRTEKFTKLKTEDWINDVYIKDSLVYLATNNGLFYSNINQPDWDAKLSRIPSYKGDAYVSIVYPDEMDNLWIGTRYDGVYKIKHPQNIFTSIDLTESGKDFSDLSFVYADRKGKVFCYSSRNVATLQLSSIHNKAAYQAGIDHKSSLISTDGKVFQDHALNYWLFEDNCFLRADYITGEKKIIKTGIKDKLSLMFENENVVYAFFNTFFIAYDTRSNICTVKDSLSLRLSNVIYITENNAIWQIWKNNRFVRYDYSENKFYEYHNIPDLNKLNLMIPVSDSIFIFNIKNNLMFYNTENETVYKTISIPGRNSNRISDVMIDHCGKLWMSSLEGIFLFDPTSDRFVCFYSEDGTQVNRFLKYVSAPMFDGRLIFGANNRLVVVDPDKLHLQDTLSYSSNTFLVTHIEVNGKEGRDSSVANPYLLNSVTLPYNMNSVGIEFALLNFRNTYRNNYLYRIKGESEKWTNLGTNHRIDLLNLSDGKYVIEIKALSSQGFWTKKPLEFTIIITPPWYKTLLFRIFVILLIILAAYLAFAYRIREMRKINVRLEEEVRLRTKEIEAQKEELKMQAGNLSNTNALLVERQEELEAATEELRAQSEELHLSNTELNKLNATKDKFFSIIAHDLKNPFSGIMSAAELVVSKFRQFSDDEKLSFITMIRDSSKGAYQLLQNLLEWSRLQTKGIKFNPEKFDLSNLVDETISLVKMNADQKNIRLISSITENYSVFADINMIRTVLRNLITNAIKFTPESGKIEILEAAEGKFVKIMVKDSGVGMDKETQNKLFKIENQVSTTGTSGESGTGLGLILCKDFVESNSGKISVESEPGAGSCFMFTLPVTEGTTPTPRKKEDDEISVKPLTTLEDDVINPDDELNDKIDESVFRDYTILIVEDNINIRKTITEALKGYYKIIEAVNGADGLKKAEENIPDMIISDVMMPEMDGFELVSRLKNGETTSHIPIIMLTARTSDKSRIKGLESGVADYLDKPFNQDVLRVRIKNILYARKKLWEKFALDLAVQPKDITKSSTEEKFLKNAIRIVEENIENPDFDVNTFTEQMGMSRMSMYRQMEQVVGQSISDFIRTIRLKRAAILLKEYNLNVSETAYKVGFKETTVFSKAFKRHFGVPPAEWIKH